MELFLFVVELKWTPQQTHVSYEALRVHVYRTIPLLGGRRAIIISSSAHQLRAATVRHHSCELGPDTIPLPIIMRAIPPHVYYGRNEKDCKPQPQAG